MSEPMRSPQGKPTQTPNVGVLLGDQRNEPVLYSEHLLGGIGQGVTA